MLLTRNPCPLSGKKKQLLRSCRLFKVPQGTGTDPTFLTPTIWASQRPLRPVFGLLTEPSGAIRPTGDKLGTFFSCGWGARPKGRVGTWESCNPPAPPCPISCLSPSVPLFRARPLLPSSFWELASSPVRAHCSLNLQTQFCAPLGQPLVSPLYPLTTSLARFVGLRSPVPVHHVSAYVLLDSILLVPLPHALRPHGTEH